MVYLMTGKSFGNFSLYPSQDTHGNFRNFVTALVIGVSGSSFKGFKSYQDALENYNKAKSRGCVRVERVPGDEATFGPLSQAIM